MWERSWSWSNGSGCAPFRAAENDRAVDLELFFTPVKSLSLQGAEGKSYGGLTVRFAPGTREETLITVPSGPTTEDLPDTPLAWADFTSRFGKMEHRSGAAIFVPPQHPDFPPTWLTRYYGAQCVGWPGVKARSFEAGKPFKLGYRLWLHRQAAEFGQLQEVYQGYTRATDVRWDDVPDPVTTGLPPRTVGEHRPPRPIPEWVRTHVRIGHLPGSLPMAEQFLKAGYNVVTLNVLGNWEIVGPSASAYAAERVKQAETYMRTHVERCHAAGAKAIFYLGPVQVPSGNETFAKAHPDWLRIRPNGQPDPTPNFASIRSGYADWLLTQLAYVTREFKVDGFWFDGYAPVHLHTYDDATKQAFREFSGGKEIPQPVADAPNSPLYFDPVHDPVARLYMRWHEDYFVAFADRMREAIRRENPEAIIYVNHSANRTWYFPDMYMGEYPANYSSAVDVSSVELYWDVPGDPLYQQFVYAFLQGITHERGAAVWIQPSAHGISGISSPVEIQLRGLEGSPWGVLPEFVESTGREEYYQLHLQNMKAREEWLQKSQSISYVGIVASEQTRTLYAQGALPLYFSHTLGPSDPAWKNTCQCACSPNMIWRMPICKACAC